MIRSAVLAAAFILAAATMPAVAQDQQNQQPAWMKYDPYSAEQTDLKNPHRTESEIVMWAQATAMTALNFSPEKFNDQLLAVKPKFSAEGWGNYAGQLHNARIVEAVREHSRGISSIINGDALVTGKGEMQGAYRWIVEAPVLVTYTQKDEAGMPQEISSGRFDLIMQVGRVRQTEENDDGLVIEKWSLGTAR